MKQIEIRKPRILLFAKNHENIASFIEECDNDLDGVFKTPSEIIIQRDYGLFECPTVRIEARLFSPSHLRGHRGDMIILDFIPSIDDYKHMGGDCRC